MPLAACRCVVTHRVRCCCNGQEALPRAPTCTCFSPPHPLDERDGVRTSSPLFPTSPPLCTGSRSGCNASCVPLLSVGAAVGAGGDGEGSVRIAAAIVRYSRLLCHPAEVVTHASAAASTTQAAHRASAQRIYDGGDTVSTRTTAAQEAGRDAHYRFLWLRATRRSRNGHKEAANPLTFVARCVRATVQQRRVSPTTCRGISLE